jgi:hypothetical protein
MPYGPFLLKARCSDTGSYNLMAMISGRNKKAKNIFYIYHHSRQKTTNVLYITPLIVANLLQAIPKRIYVLGAQA